MQNKTYNKTCCFWNHFCLLCNMRTSLFSSSTYLGWYPRQKYVCRYILTYLFFSPTLFVKMMMKFLRFFFLKKYYTLHAFCFLHCFKITLRQCSHQILLDNYQSKLVVIYRLTIQKNFLIRISRSFEKGASENTISYFDQSFWFSGL